MEASGREGEEPNSSRRKKLRTSTEQLSPLAWWEEGQEEAKEEQDEQDEQQQGQ